MGSKVDLTVAERVAESIAIPPRRLHVILNACSGTPGKETAARRVTDYLSARGMRADIEIVRNGAELLAAAERSAAADADAVIAGGGDGTIAAVAARVLNTNKVLGILPLGTFNYFAQRLGVPLDLDAALEIIASGAVGRVSVGEVNGRLFLNNSSIGLYPAILRRREAAYRRIGRRQATAYMSVALVLVQPPALLNLQLTADDVQLSRRTALLFVGVNSHQLASFGIPSCECPDQGRLALYVTRPLTIPQLWRLALRGFLRGLHGTDAFETICARTLVVTLRRRRIRLALDGEVIRLRGPLRYRLRQDALRVFVPQQAAGGDET